LAPITINLGSHAYQDLDQQPVQGSVTLQPFTSKILVDTLVPDILNLYLPLIAR
jgi:hypothetical protein